MQGHSGHISTACCPGSFQIPCNRSRILVVDDESAIRRVFQRLLSHALPDCRADPATDGAEAVRNFSAEHHGILIMDLRMPVMDGLAAFSEIRKICETKNWEMPSVIFCTGYIPPNGVHEIVAKNPDHCLLQKPMSNEIFLQVVKSRLRHIPAVESSPAS